MIHHICGELCEKNTNYVVIEAYGVGYEILIPLSTYEKLPRCGEKAKLLVSHIVREDDEVLYGFYTEKERELFKLLLSVSGVGPKIALQIVSGGSLSEIVLAITSSNAKRISSIKGVGKKTAEKICVELHDKVDVIDAMVNQEIYSGESVRNSILRDAVLALGALGFSEEIANKKVAAALAKDPNPVDVEAVVKNALMK